MATVTNHVPAAADLPRTDILGIEDRFPELVRITEDLFGAPATVIVEPDAELPGIRYAVVETTSSHDLKQVAQFHREWHRRVRALLGAYSRKVRLSVDVQE